METATDKFINSVLEKLNISNPEDQPIVWAEVAMLYYRGFNLNEAVAFCNCMKEISPHISRDISLRRMNAISNQVETRIKSKNSHGQKV